MPTMENPLALESARSLVGAVLIAPSSRCRCASCVRWCPGGTVPAAHGVERLQLKWLATAGALVASMYRRHRRGHVRWRLCRRRARHLGKVIEDLAMFSFLLIPVAIGVAILRHRLYDIDVVINRTLVYGPDRDPGRTVYLGVGAGAQGGCAR